MGGHRLFGGSVVWKHLRSCYTVRADVTDRSHCGVHHVTQQHALAAPCPPFLSQSAFDACFKEQWTAK